MERSSGGGSSRNHLQQQQPPWMSWTSSSYHHHHQEFLTWPPRSYTCSFCKREFRSAQALGGHMNVHRRDRARLRQSPPWDPPPFCTNPNPNPNVPNLNLSPPPPPSTASEAKQLSHSPPVAYTFASLLSPLDRASPKAGPSSKAFSAGPFQSRRNELRSMGTVKHAAPIFRGGEFEGIAEEVDLKVAVARKEEEKIKTEWIGLQEISSVEEGLDLELRLGYT